MAINELISGGIVAAWLAIKNCAYPARKWWLKRQIAMCKYRREELEAIVRRERLAIDGDEHHLNARLRELESDRLHRGLVSDSP